MNKAIEALKKIYVNDVDIKAKYNILIHIARNTDEDKKVCYKIEM